jgi:hypothetical protein
MVFVIRLAKSPHAKMGYLGILSFFSSYLDLSNIISS